MKDKPKPKISTENLCRDYYDSQIFNSNGDFETRLVSEIFLRQGAFRIDHSVFERELYGVNVELFGLAWFHHNYQLYQSERLESERAQSASIAEIMFTKSFLKQRGDDSTWSTAGFYNDVIFQASMADQTSRDWSVPRDSGYYRRDVQFPTQSEKLFEQSIRDDLEKLIADRECAKRFANRLLSNNSWQKGIVIPQKLSLAFTQRLGFNPNIETFLLLQTLIVGIYNNTRNYINAVIDYGSWELARKESDNLLKHIITVVHKDLESKKGSED